MTTQLREYILAWMQKATNDLMSAERLIDIEPMILDSACFHCQQAIEKSLKAFLCYHSKDIVRTHDISYLLNDCAKIDPVFGTINPLNINEFAVSIRYPDFSLAPDITETREMFELATTIFILVQEKLKWE
jgi:HEPN domain-containing protein